jgi:aminotransferase
MVFVSRRLEGLAQSDIRRMTRECLRVGGINLGQGLGRLPTPEVVADAAKAAIDARKATYTLPEGIVELREAIAAKLERDNGISAGADEIVVTLGATGAFAAALTGLLDPGDGVLLMEPFYGYHLNTAVVAGLEPHYLELQAPAFALTEAALRAALRPNTRAMVVCTPSNPSGKMFSRAELELVARVARERDLLVITDEIYEYIRYDQREHISPAAVADLWDRTVTIMGFSKTFSMTGWRLGYAVARRELARSIILVNDLYYVCAAAPLQYGVTAGFGLPASYFEGLRATYQRKRDLLCAALDDAGDRARGCLLRARRVLAPRPAHGARRRDVPAQRGEGRRGPRFGVLPRRGGRDPAAFLLRRRGRRARRGVRTAAPVPSLTGAVRRPRRSAAR